MGNSFPSVSMRQNSTSLITRLAEMRWLRVAGWLLIGHGQPPRRRGSLAAATLVCVLAAGWMIGGKWLPATGSVLAGSHGAVSLNLAVNRVFCGKPAHLSYRIYVAELISKNPALRTRPLRQVAADAAGSLEQDL